MRTFLFMLVLSTFVGTGLCEAQRRRPQQGKGIVEGSPAYEFTLKRVDREGTVCLADLRDRPVVLIFGSYT